MTTYDGYAFRRAIRYAELSTGAVAVAHDLATYADNETGKCFPTQEQLAEGTGLSVRSVQRVMVELKDAGLVHIEKNKARSYNANSIYWCRVPRGTPPATKAEVSRKAKPVRPPPSPPPRPAPAVAVPMPQHPKPLPMPLPGEAFPTEPVWRKW